MSAKERAAMRAKYQHSGKGPPVLDQSGWKLGPGDQPISLPPAADATVLAAVRNETLVKVEAIKVKVKPNGEEKVKRDDRELLKVLIKLAIAEGDESNLTSSGKPTIDYLKSEMIGEDGDPDFVTSTIRDELFDEIGKE